MSSALKLKTYRLVQSKTTFVFSNDCTLQSTKTIIRPPLQNLKLRCDTAQIVLVVWDPSDLVKMLRPSGKEAVIRFANGGTKIRHEQETLETARLCELDSSTVLLPHTVLLTRQGQWQRTSACPFYRVGGCRLCVR